jgi:hypothetical protein
MEVTLADAPVEWVVRRGVKDITLRNELNLGFTMREESQQTVDT